MVEMAVNELGQARDVAEQASGRRRSGRKRKRRPPCSSWDKRALAQAIAANQPAIVLAGHSYNAFTPEASQSVGKKLSSMGVAAIPGRLPCCRPAPARPPGISPTR